MYVICMYVCMYVCVCCLLRTRSRETCQFGERVHDMVDPLHFMQWIGNDEVTQHRNRSLQEFQEAGKLQRSLRQQLCTLALKAAGGGCEQLLVGAHSAGITQAICAGAVGASSAPTHCDKCMGIHCAIHCAHCRMKGGYWNVCLCVGWLCRGVATLLLTPFFLE